MSSKDDEAIVDVEQKHHQVQSNDSGDCKIVSSNIRHEDEAESTMGSVPKNLQEEENSIGEKCEDNQQNASTVVANSIDSKDICKDAESIPISKSLNKAPQTQGNMVDEVIFLDEEEHESIEERQQSNVENRFITALLSMNDNIKQSVVDAKSNTDNVLCIDVDKGATKFNENIPEDVNFLEDDEEHNLHERQQTIDEHCSSSAIASLSMEEDWEINAGSLLDEGVEDENTKIGADVLDEVDFLQETVDDKVHEIANSQKTDISNSEGRQLNRSESKTDEELPSKSANFEGEKSIEEFGDIDKNNFLFKESTSSLTRIGEDELLGFNILGEEEYECNNTYWTGTLNEQLNEDILLERIDQLEDYSIGNDIGDIQIHTDVGIISEILKNILDTLDDSSINNSNNRFEDISTNEYYRSGNNQKIEDINDDSIEFLDSKEKPMDYLQIVIESDSDEASERIEHSNESGDEGNDADRSSMSVQDEDDEECDGEKVIPTGTHTGETLAASSHSTAYRLPTNLEIREGIDYQCAIEEEMQERGELSRSESEDRDYCLWLPKDTLDDDAINDYLSVALGVYGIEQDRALYILYTCHYDFNSAYKEIKKRQVLKEEWSEEDVSSFLRAFKTFGKRFSKIRKVMPHKSTAQLVNFYYDMKKKLHLKSILEQRIEEGVEDDSTDASDCEEQSDERHIIGSCDSCRHVDSNLKQAGNKNLCSTCYTYCRGSQRRWPHVMTSFECEHNDNKYVKCPLKMVDVVESFADFYTQYFVDQKNDEEIANSQISEGDNDVIIVQSTANDNAITSRSSYSIEEYCKDKLKKMMQEKEKLALREHSRCLRMQHEDSLQVEHCLSAGIEKYRQLAAEWTERADCASIRTSWSQQEIFEAFLGFRHFGKDFEAIARSLRTKNIDMVKQFYEQHKERADQLIKKYEGALEQNMKKVDFERLYEVVAPQAEVVEIE